MKIPGFDATAVFDDASPVRGGRVRADDRDVEMASCASDCDHKFDTCIVLTSIFAPFLSWTCYVDRDRCRGNCITVTPVGVIQQP